MIFVGYQGVGKSTLCRSSMYAEAFDTETCIDLESSCFWVKDGNDRVRSRNWEKVYVQMAANISRQGFHVFMSSHTGVRSALCDSAFDDIKKAIIFPSLELKDEWLERLKQRFDETKLTKDEAAYMNAKTIYEKNIQALMGEDQKIFDLIKINQIPYSLFDIINEYLLSIQSGRPL